MIKNADKREYKKIAPFLKKLGFTSNEFPDIHNDLLIDSAFSFFFREKWERTEEVFRGYPDILALCVGKMLSKVGNQFDEGVSICLRNSEVIKYLKFPEKMRKEIEKRKKFVINSLQTNRFEPSDPNSFCCFSDFNLYRKNVFFVNENHPNTEALIKSISNSKIIGIDT